MCYTSAPDACIAPTNIKNSYIILQDLRFLIEFFFFAVNIYKLNNLYDGDHLKAVTLLLVDQHHFKNVQPLPKFQPKQLKKRFIDCSHRNNTKEYVSQHMSKLFSFA